MIKYFVAVLMIALLLGASMPTAGAAGPVTFTCVLLDLEVLDVRAQVLCAEPITVYRGGYPLDNGYAVKYFAVPLSKTDWSGRFIQVADIAMASGMPVRLSYTSGDYSGESFGCARTDCRTPWAFTLVKTSWTP